MIAANIIGGNTLSQQFTIHQNLISVETLISEWMLVKQVTQKSCQQLLAPFYG